MPEPPRASQYSKARPKLLREADEIAHNPRRATAEARESVRQSIVVLEESMEALARVNKLLRESLLLGARAKD